MASTSVVAGGLVAKVAMLFLGCWLAYHMFFKKPKKEEVPEK